MNIYKQFYYFKAQACEIISKGALSRLLFCVIHSIATNNQRRANEAKKR